jgi:D-alanyl-D-alanine carboxypeptidase
MSGIRYARPTARRVNGSGAVGLVVAAVIVASLAYLSAGASRTSIGDLVHGPDSAVAAADGGLPDGATVFDDHDPGIARLDPQLLQALRAAATRAADDGVRFHVNSGWRSPVYQERLLNEATAKYGSAREAARWVAPVNRSAHVTGDAVDLDAGAWLSEHGAAYGLCQIYRNEAWHYELRPEARTAGCPAPYADASEDPRMWN